MKRKRGLGKLLIRGFQKRGVRSNPTTRPNLILNKRIVVKKTLNLSRMRSAQIHPAAPNPKSTPSVVPTHAPVAAEPVITESIVTQPVAIEPITTGPGAAEGASAPQKALPEPISVPSVPQLRLEPPPPPPPFEATQGYLIHDIIKPDDRLKQSIEAFLLDQRSPHTRRAYQKDLKRFIQFLLTRKQNASFEQLNRTVLIAYKESLLADGLQHTSVDRHLATLRSFFKWLVDDGLISKSPADGVRFLNPKRISRTIGFSDEEVKKVLAIPNLHTRVGSMHYAVLMVLFYCGLRRSELCSLRTTNLGVERNQRVLRLRGKGNAERVIVMIPPVWNALAHYFFITRRNFTKDDYLFLPLRNNRTSDLNKALDPSMIFYIVTRYSRLAGISNRVSPHSCRATAISNARDHHVPDRAIQEFAGWASPDMITRYDKRRTSVENSAAHAISYGAEDRSLPLTAQFSETPEEEVPVSGSSSPQSE